MYIIRVLKTIDHTLKQKQFYVMFVVIFTIGVYGLMYENIVGTQIESQMLVLQHSGFKERDHAKVRVLCLIPTEFKYHQTKASVINSTWAKRCDFLQFVSDQPDDSLPVMVLNSSGWGNLWGKTKTMFSAVNASVEFDWVLKADTDSYIIMENLKNLLSHYNASEPLFAGSIYICRSNTKECNDFDGDEKTDEVYMTGGAGYVLSREAVRRFVSGYVNQTKCRPGDQGPEDVEMSRCLQRLGVSFIDTRDKDGRNRFFHFSAEDALSLPENVHRPDLSWILNYGILPMATGPECCSKKAISFHHLSIQQIKMMEYMVYNLRPQASDDKDLNMPADEATLPNTMLDHSDILEVVMNIRNATLRKEILLKPNINFTNAAQILNKEKQNDTFNCGELVFLKLDLAFELPERVFKIERVIENSESEATWLILNETVGAGNLCKVEKSKVVGDDENNKDGKESKYKIENNITTARISRQIEEAHAVTFLEVESFCA